MASFFESMKKAAQRIGHFMTAGYEAEQELLRINLAKPPKENESAEITALRRALREEPLTRQFHRFAARIARAANHQPIELQDLNVIKLPETPAGRYFAKRNADQRWNVWHRTGHAQGPEPIRDTLLGMDLTIGDALNMLAAQSRTAMQKQTYMHWHPLHVAARIHHVFPDELGHKIPVPRGLLPDTPKSKLPRPPRRG